MQDYIARIAEIHRSLGIPESYAAARKLPLVEEASGEDLTAVECVVPNALFGRSCAGKRFGDNTLHRNRAIPLLTPATAAWNRLAATAAAEGVIVLPLSGFRSVARQVEIIRAKLLAGKSIEEILRLNAAPGYSEHHSGRAIDVGAPGEAPLTEVFERSPAFAWLVGRAGEFGFQLSYPRANPHGIAYEPWHWCWQT